ncbi:MAG TPA: TIGR00269 family protein [Candidatus Nanoarchaeia archaeon]|nr:TIGR00269 family protein [Candidatus Nanoarchaeia archaeon]
MACKSCKQFPVYATQNHEHLCKNHFSRYFERKVFKTITKYKMIEKADKIAVALSGGKDSSVLLYLLNKFREQYQGFELSAVLIDEGIPSYREITRKDAVKFCRQLGIPLKIISFRQETGKRLSQLVKNKHNPCATCGVLRRYFLNKGARELHATKIATGHNADDEAQSIWMNSIKGNLEFSAKLGPVTGMIVHEKFVKRIKPLYFMLEKEVLIYSKVQNLPVTFVECPNTRLSFRNEIGRILNELEAKYPGTKQSILNSFLEILPALKSHFREGKKHLGTCKLCGEPAVKEFCRACGLIKKVKQ